RCAAGPHRVRSLPAAADAGRDRLDRAVRHGQGWDGKADLEPALRLVGIFGFLIGATGLLALRLPAVAGLPEGGGGILGRLVGNSLHAAFGSVGGNLFLLALLLGSITLATGLSW